LGASFDGKKASKQIKGGVLIYNTTFSIKEWGNKYSLIFLFLY
jgi:hypothetical protein